MLLLFQTSNRTKVELKRLSATYFTIAKNLKKSVSHIAGYFVVSSGFNYPDSIKIVDFALPFLQDKDTKHCPVLIIFAATLKQI